MVEKKFDEIFETLEVRFKIVDDMVIFGKLKHERDQNRMAFLQS